MFPPQCWKVPSISWSVYLSITHALAHFVSGATTQAGTTSVSHMKRILKSCATFHPKYATCFVPTSCAHVDQTRAGKTVRKYRVWGISYIFTYSLCTHTLYIFRLIQQKRGLCSVSESTCSQCCTSSSIIHRMVQKHAFEALQNPFNALMFCLFEPNCVLLQLIKNG